jgi:hypothetical protein
MEDEKKTTRVVVSKSDFIKHYIETSRTEGTFSDFLARVGKSKSSKAAMKQRLKTINTELNNDGFQSLPALGKETFDFNELFDQGYLKKSL